MVASDDMEGRDTPSRGLDLTAKFIADHLSQWGVKPGGDDGTYFQKFALTSRRVEPELTVASVNGQGFNLGEDFIAEPTPGQASGRIVYGGHGHMIRAKGIDAYRGVDVKGKIMLAVEGYPRGVSFQDIQGKKAGEDYDTPETYARAWGKRRHLHSQPIDANLLAESSLHLSELVARQAGEAAAGRGEYSRHLRLRKDGQSDPRWREAQLRDGQEAGERGRAGRRFRPRRRRRPASMSTRRSMRR